MAAVLVGLLPWWLPTIAKPVAGRFGVTFERYERLGYQRFALEDVRFQRSSVVVTIERVEVDTPLLWAWRHIRSRETTVDATRWKVAVEPRKGPRSTAPSGWLLLRSRLQRIAASLDRWLPHARIGQGEVRWPGGGLTLNSATWRAGHLQTKGLTYRAFTADVSLAFKDEDVIAVQASDAVHQGGAKLESRGDSVAGEISLWDQVALVGSRFGDTGWIPIEGSVSVARLNLPGERVKLGGSYARIEGDASITWRWQHFDLNVNLQGVAETRGAPPLHVTLVAAGDNRRITVEQLRASMPGAVADLSAPVTIDRSGHVIGTPARFAFEMELSRLPWFEASGSLAGTATVVPNAAATAVDFECVARDIVARDAAIPKARAQGTFVWPVATVREAELVDSDGGTLRAAGAWDIRARRLIDASAQGSIAGSTLARWLPRKLAFGRVELEAKAGGVLPDLQHEGTARFSQLRFGPTKPAEATVSWNSVGGGQTSFRAVTHFGPIEIAASGIAGTAGVKVETCTLREADTDILELAAPAEVRWRPHMHVGPVRMRGPDSSLDLRLVWGTEGSLELAVTGFQSRWVAAIVPQRGPQWTLGSFAMTGTWAAGPMEYATAGELSIALPGGRSARLNMSAKGAGDGIVLEALRAVESGNPVVDASGRFPVALHPGTSQIVSFDPQGRLTLSATTVPNAAFWQQLAEMTGVELQAPRIEAKLGGTWKEPRGSVTFRADRAAMDPKRFSRPFPTVEQVDLSVTSTNRGIQIDRLSFTVERQAVRATGRVAVDEGDWRQLLREPLTYARRHSELRIEVPDAEVAMFKRFLPAALAPAGRLSADLQVNKGKLGGSLQLRDAASRPLGPLGVLRQVTADVEFAGDTIVLRRVSAMSGGQPLTVTGTIGLPVDGWVSGYADEPRYDVTVRGQNLPFVRQAGLLLRGDVALTLHTPKEGETTLSGVVVLRDSLFLTDIRAFLPQGGGASPSRRPPYFSVDTPPLNAWVLDVEVKGTRFMRVRTPVFSGLASARFRLGGTLGEPRAIGDATVEEGQVLMPFASFEVRQGAVRLTEESPHEPTVFLRGTARHWGYDLNMEVSGKASAPAITFTSSPALDSEQILLMVMTGAAPANEMSNTLTNRAVQIGAFLGQSLVGNLTGGGGEPDRLTVESGERISEQGRETYSIEYKLNDRWSVTGEYDEFDQYNAGFKWRIAPRKREK